jgi:hypothetical protein
MGSARTRTETGLRLLMAFTTLLTTVIDHAL